MESAGRRFDHCRRRRRPGISAHLKISRDLFPVCPHNFKLINQDVQDALRGRLLH